MVSFSKMSIVKRLLVGIFCLGIFLAVAPQIMGDQYSITTPYDYTLSASGWDYHTQNFSVPINVTRVTSVHYTFSCDVNEFSAWQRVPSFSIIDVNTGQSMINGSSGNFTPIIGHTYQAYVGGGVDKHNVYYTTTSGEITYTTYIDRYYSP